MAILNNILADIPDIITHEICDILLNHPNVHIERIVSRGQANAEGFWYDQDMNEWVLLLQGAARLRFEGGDAVELIPGSHINIAAHQKHRVDWTDPNKVTIWLAIYYR